MLLLSIRALVIGWAVSVLLGFGFAELIAILAPRIGTEWAGTADLASGCLVMVAAGWCSAKASPTPRLLPTAILGLSLLSADLSRFLPLNGPWLLRLLLNALDDSRFATSLASQVFIHALLLGCVVAGRNAYRARYHGPMSRGPLLSTFLTVFLFAGAFAGAFTGVARAQDKQAPPPPPPPLMSCGEHGNIEVLCGARSPEDIEITPDGKYLMVPQYVTGRGVTTEGIQLFDMATKKYSKMEIANDPKPDWGDPSCPGPIGGALVGHGTSLIKRRGGALAYYVVNHGGRQSIEMFELKKASPWSLIWRGCVPTQAEFNDVAALPDGSFIATHPTILRTPGAPGNIFNGQPSGYVIRWAAGKGETELPGTRGAYPNGVVVDASQRYMYFNIFASREIHKYDLKTQKDVGKVAVDFMPDNLTWTAKKQLLGAGVKGANGECPAGSGQLCIQGFGIAQIDPASMKATTVFDSNGKGAIIGGVSVAFEAGKSIYIGAFQGDRLVRIPR